MTANEMEAIIAPVLVKADAFLESHVGDSQEARRELGDLIILAVTRAHQGFQQVVQEGLAEAIQDGLIFTPGRVN